MPVVGVRTHKRFNFLFVAAGLLVVTAAQAAEPVVFWSSSPVEPNQTALLAGAYGDQTPISIGRLADGDPGTPREPRLDPAILRGSEACTPLHQSKTCLKVVIPATFARGMFAVTAPGTRLLHVLNAPDVWWIQGDQTSTASPGGWLRLFGRCLGRKDPKQESRVVLVSAAGTTTSLPARQTENPLKTGSGLDTWGYSLRCDVPADMPPGTYAVWVHNGCGGEYGWRQGGEIEVKPTVQAEWPQRRFDLSEYLHTTAGNVQQALDLALEEVREHGGGILTIPAGLYRGLTKTIDLPPKTVLAGAGRDQTFLHWQHAGESPPVALVRGSHSFCVRDLSLDAQNHAAGIITAPDSQGDVWIERVYLYMNRLKQMDPRHYQNAWKDKIVETAYQDESPALYLSGRNVHVTDSKVWTTGLLMIFHAMSGEVARNQLLAPVLNGGYRIEGCENLILEGNEISSGGCIATYNHSPGRFIKGERTTPSFLTRSRSIFFAENLLENSWRMDAEAMTVDFHPPVNIYAGPLAEGHPNRIVLPEPHALFTYESERSARRMEPGKDYTLVLKLEAHEGETWDRCFLKVFGPEDDPGAAEPQTWDSTGTVRASKAKYDQLQVSASQGIEIASFIAGRTWQSVLGEDESNVLLTERFSSAEPWRGDRDLSQPLPAAVTFGAGGLQFTQPAGTARLYREADAQAIDMDRKATYYLACRVKANELGSFMIGLEDNASRKAGFDRTRVSMGSVLQSPPSDKTFAGAWKDALVYIMDGTGAGQVRRIAGAHGRELRVDRPWDVTPDRSSFIVIPKSFANGLFVRNSFRESGNFQFWGGSFDQIIDGNLFDRCHSLLAMGLGVYGGMVPSARCQIINNARIEPGGGFSIGADGNEPRYTGPMFRLGVIRGNRNSNTGIDGNVRDGVLEDNVNAFHPWTYAEWMARQRNAGMQLLSESHEPTRDHLTWLDPVKGLVSRDNQPAPPWATLPRVYVNGRVEKSGDGLSWEGAVKTVQEGVARAEALGIEMIYVASGTYVAASGKSDGLRIRQQLYGGFAGTEPAWFSLADRDIAAHETILTREGDGPVLFWHNTAGVAVDGFTILGGHASNGPGGILASQSGIGAASRIAHCRFIDNRGSAAGAILVRRAGPVGQARVEIESCTFSGNGDTSGGQAISVAADACVRMRRCVFDGATTGGAKNVVGDPAAILIED